MGLFVLTCAAAACGSSTSSSPAQAAANAANRLLGAQNFTFHESDHATSPISTGNFSLTTAGTRTQQAVLGTVVGTTSGGPTRFTLYATKNTYCHIGDNTAGSAGCAAGDGYDDYLTFDALYYLRTIAKDAAHVQASGGDYTFSGSAVNNSTTPSIHEAWHGSFKIAGGYIVQLQYTQTGSEGAVGTGSVDFSKIGTSPSVNTPPGASD